MQQLKIIRTLDELDHLVSLLQDKTVSIFGASKFGMETYNMLTDKNLKVSKIYDNDINKIDTYFNNIKVDNPKNICVDEHIVITSMYYKEIYQQLKDMGVKYIYYITSTLIDYYNFNKALDWKLLNSICSYKKQDKKKSSINILHLYNLMELGGIETHIITLSNQLNKMNVNNIIVAPKGPAIKLVNQYNIDYKSIDINKKEKINEIVMDINSIIMEKNINIIHAHSPIAQMIGSICNILTGVPVVVTNHSVLHCNYIDKRYSSMANKYICISNEVAKHCVEEGISKDKITIINNCVEIIDEPH